jgi:hypothetical protein
VVIPVMTTHYMLLQRPLLYTAVTRARRLVVLVGTRRAIAIAVRNNRVALRNSGLSERLAQKEPPLNPPRDLYGGEEASPVSRDRQEVDSQARPSFSPPPPREGLRGGKGEGRDG